MAKILAYTDHLMKKYCAVLQSQLHNQSKSWTQATICHIIVMMGWTQPA